ncbi:MAG TPA: PAS domain S-box protein [Nevskiaceae bacterium]|nr:PAS domain S-box protein [Nevskiaceae bacterium]
MTVIEGRDELLRELILGMRDYAIFLLNPQGIVSSWNAGAERIKGYTAEDIIGKHFSTFYPEEAVRRGWPDHELKVAAADGRFEDEGWRVRKDGTMFWANVVITALKDPSGKLRGFSKITRDLTERRRHEEALRESEERFRLLVDGVRDYAIFMLDPTGEIASWNSGATNTTGYRANEVIGRNFDLLFRSEDSAANRPQALLDVARLEGRAEDEGWRVRKDGSLFWANTVVTALRDASNSLRGFAMITRDLTERRRMETLEESERQATNFLAMLAHELRNPLAPIRNAVAVMKTPGINPSSSAFALDVIDRQALHMSRLVDDLLDVSRITTGKIVLKKEPIDLSLALGQAIETSKPAIAAFSHQLRYTPATTPLAVEGDLTRLIQVFTNLLDNAAKYTPRGGIITVTSEQIGAEAVVKVQDTGTGIPATLLPRVFDLFVQGDRSLARSEGGLGIGLALARRLVQMHGGLIEAQSAGAGYGATFIVRIPLVQAVSSLPLGSVKPTLPSAVSRKILVVDDNRDAAQTLCAYLQGSGNSVRVAFDGPSAFALASEFQPDVVLLDIGLPGMSGYEVAALLRAEPRFKDTVLVAVTGYGREADRDRAQQSGFNHHFTKPVDPAAILAAIGPAPPRPRAPM